MVEVDVGILWMFLGSALVVLMQAQAIRLAKTNRELAASETALRMRNAELDTANSRLSEVDALKNRFLATVSQELRRPLSTLVSEAKLLGRQHYDDVDTVRRISGAIANEAEHLARLVDGLSDRGQTEWQVVDASERKIDPGELLRAAVATISSVAKVQQVDVECQAPADLSQVWANYDRLVHALVLLLDSAITYTPPHREVLAEVGSEGPEIVFRIKQPARKQTPDARKELRAAANGKDNGGGFAVELCREIVEAHRGRFWIDTGTTIGTTYHVALPAIDYEPRTAAYSDRRSAGTVA